MTFADSSTPVSEVQAPALQVILLDPADLQAVATVAAQQAGNLAYDAADLAGLSDYDVACAYHFAFVSTSRAMGVRVSCSCDYCAAL